MHVIIAPPVTGAQSQQPRVHTAQAGHDGPTFKSSRQPWWSKEEENFGTLGTTSVV